MPRDDYDFWVFDLDGTLVDIEPSYPREVIADVGDRLGVGFTETDAVSLWYGMGGTRDRCLRRRGVDPERFWEVFHEVEDPQARAAATYLYDDAEQFVGGIDGPVGLVTHCQRYLTDPVLDELDIDDWFDSVVCCTEEIGWKPDPGPVERVMNDMGVGYDGHVGVPASGASGSSGGRRPAGAMAGDDADDVGAAWNAGLDAVHVERHDPETRGQCVMGDHRVTSFTELH